MLIHARPCYPTQERGYEIIMYEATPCYCPRCDAEYVEWLTTLHDMDLLAAHDPESREQLRCDFDVWLASNPEPPR